MSNTTIKLAKSLSAESIELIPYLPYLLQDLWELGSSPQDMIKLISQHVPHAYSTRVLDLACGKGAVSVLIAKAFGCKVKGIDIMPEFIDYSITKAIEYNVSDLCEFTVGDIKESVHIEKEYDIVILGAVGDVLGDIKETLKLLKETIKQTGYILIDDAYGHNETDTTQLTKEAWFDVIHHLGLEFVDDMMITKEALAKINDMQQKLILNRANELKGLYHEHVNLFDGYISSQNSECEQLENELTGVTILLKNGHA